MNDGLVDRQTNVCQVAIPAFGNSEWSNNDVRATTDILSRSCMKSIARVPAARRRWQPRVSMLAVKAIASSYSCADNLRKRTAKASNDAEWRSFQCSELQKQTQLFSYFDFLLGAANPVRWCDFLDIAFSDLLWSG